MEAGTKQLQIMIKGIGLTLFTLLIFQVGYRQSQDNAHSTSFDSGLLLNKDALAAALLQSLLRT
jgi:hypothetical protein